MALMFTHYLSSSRPHRAGMVLRRGLAVVLLLVSASLPAAALPNRPIDAIDLPRYMGQWHEIAHLPLFFQRKCVGPITATSAIDADGKIRLHTSCPTQHKPKIVDVLVIPEQQQPAVFTIQIGWLSWLPHSWFEYWVVDIDPQYQWVVIGEANAKHLWIFARSRTMSRALYQHLVKRARDRGYPVDKLMIVAPLDDR